MEHKSSDSFFSNIPKTVWMLGFVSLFMSASSVMITILSPIFITTVLGASTGLAGMIEGIVESLSSLLKVFSGTVSDKLKKRKFLMVIGYACATLVKPLFALAQSVTWVFTARIIDRLSNGLRDTPRDALMADVSPAHIKGQCFGLRTAMGSMGALTGGVITFLLVWGLNIDFRTVFWISLIPSSFAVFLLVFFVKDKTSHQTKNHIVIAEPEFKWSDIALIPKSFWYLLAIVFVFMLGRFSEGLLVLRAFDIINHDSSLHTLFLDGNSMSSKISLTCGVMILMNMCYSGVAYPLGRISDRFDKRAVLVIGCIALIIGNGFLAIGTSWIHAMFGVMFWGIHMGVVQGLFASMVVERAPTHLKGTAFGAFHFFMGFAVLSGNSLAGTLWHTVSPYVAFIMGSIAVFVAMIMVAFLPKYGKIAKEHAL